MVLGLIVFFVLLYLIYYKNENEHFEQIWWKPSPSTRNMSYDLRCEPPIRKKNYPFYGSTITPLVRPKCLQ